MTANKSHPKPYGGQKSKSKRQAPIGRREESGSTAQFPRLMCKAFLITLGIGAALALLASTGVYFLPDPAPMIRPLGVAASLLTSLLGGIVAGRLHRSAPAICGLANGGLLLLAMLLFSLCFRSLAGGYSMLTSTLLHTAVPLLSFAGAVIGVNRKPSRKRPRR